MRVFSTTVAATAAVLYSATGAIAAPTAPKKLSCGGACDNKKVACTLDDGKSTKVNVTLKSFKTGPSGSEVTRCAPTAEEDTPFADEAAAIAFFGKYTLTKDSSATGDWKFGDDFAANKDALAKTFNTAFSYAAADHGFDDALSVVQKLLVDVSVKAYFDANVLPDYSGTYFPAGQTYTENVNWMDMYKAVTSQAEFQFFLVNTAWLSSENTWKQFLSAETLRTSTANAHNGNKMKTVLVFDAPSVKALFDDSMGTKPTGPAAAIKAVRDKAVADSGDVFAATPEAWFRELACPDETCDPSTRKDRITKTVEDFLAKHGDDKDGGCSTCCCVTVIIVVVLVVVLAVILLLTVFLRKEESELDSSSSGQY